MGVKDFVGFLAGEQARMNAVFAKTGTSLGGRGGSGGDRVKRALVMDSVSLLKALQDAAIFGGDKKYPPIFPWQTRALAARVRLFASIANECFGRVVLVLDNGQRPKPGKLEENMKRFKEKNERAAGATTSSDIFNPNEIHIFIDTLEAQGVEVIVAPDEADRLVIKQALALKQRTEDVFVLTSDTDMVFYPEAVPLSIIFLPFIHVKSLNCFTLCIEGRNMRFHTATVKGTANLLDIPVEALPTFCVLNGNDYVTMEDLLPVHTAVYTAWYKDRCSSMEEKNAGVLRKLREEELKLRKSGSMKGRPCNNGASCRNFKCVYSHAEGRKMLCCNKPCAKFDRCNFVHSRLPFAVIAFSTHDEREMEAFRSAADNKWSFNKNALTGMFYANRECESYASAMKIIASLDFRVSLAGRMRHTRITRIARIVKDAAAAAQESTARSVLRCALEETNFVELFKTLSLHLHEYYTLDQQGEGGNIHPDAFFKRYVYMPPCFAASPWKLTAKLRMAALLTLGDSDGFLPGKEMLYNEKTREVVKCACTMTDEEQKNISILRMLECDDVPPALIDAVPGSDMGLMALAMRFLLKSSAQSAFTHQIVDALLANIAKNANTTPKTSEKLKSVCDESDDWCVLTAAASYWCVCLKSTYLLSKALGFPLGKMRLENGFDGPSFLSLYEKLSTSGAEEMIEATIQQHLDSKQAQDTFKALVDVAKYGISGLQGYNIFASSAANSTAMMTGIALKDLDLGDWDDEDDWD